MFFYICYIEFHLYVGFVFPVVSHLIALPFSHVLCAAWLPRCFEIFLWALPSFGYQMRFIDTVTIEERV